MRQVKYPSKVCYQTSETISKNTNMPYATGCNDLQKGKGGQRQKLHTSLPSIYHSIYLRLPYI